MGCAMGIFVIVCFDLEGLFIWGGRYGGEGRGGGGEERHLSFRGKDIRSVPISIGQVDFCFFPLGEGILVGW